MNISAVSGKAVRRDIDVFSGRAESVVLTVYLADDVLQSAVDMDGETLQLKVYLANEYMRDYGSVVPDTTAILSKDTTEGASNTFSITASDTLKLKGRYAYMINQGVGDAVSCLTYGAFTVK